MKTLKKHIAIIQPRNLADLRKKRSGLLDSYPDEMRKFQNTYTAAREIDDKMAYLFFIEGETENKGRDYSGYMPRNKQFGYIFTGSFTGNDEMHLAVAHELGHGQFVLKHTFDKDYKLPQGKTDNLMDYTRGARHIAKWQWDLIHDPGVVMRVFERDKDAAKGGGHIIGQEYVIRDGQIVDLDKSYFYNLYKSTGKDIRKFLSTKTTMSFLEDIAKSPVLNNLVFESNTGVGLAATSIGFLVPEIISNKKDYVFKGLDSMKNVSEPIYKESKLCIRIEFTNQINDHHLAHELFIHNLRAFSEVNKIDFSSLTKSEAIAQLEKISAYSRYEPTDGGDREHYEFITGQKKEMTQYTLERLLQEPTYEYKINYLRTYLSEIGKYINNPGDYPNILSKNGGYRSVVAKIKKHIQEDFKEYEDYIFETVQNLKENLNLDAGILNNDLKNKDNKHKSLWNIYIEKK